MKTLRFIGIAIFAIVLSVNFIACSNDDEVTENLAEIIVGTWAQDADGGILVINADGTGAIYRNETLYKNGEGYSFSWTYKDNWFYAGVIGVQEEELWAESVSVNKIVWRRYEDYETGNKDSFGWYRLRTWVRYTE